MSYSDEALGDLLAKSKDLAVYWEAATQRAVVITRGLRSNVVRNSADEEKKEKLRTLKMRVKVQNVMGRNQKEKVDKMVEEVKARLETSQPVGEQFKAAHDLMDAFETIMKEFCGELTAAQEYLRAEVQSLRRAAESRK